MITIIWDKKMNMWHIKKESALTESEQKHLEASMKQNKELFKGVAKL